MIIMRELIKEANFNSLSDLIQHNLTTLLERLNEVRTAWGHPMTVTSGLRTKEDQLRIYHAKGITDASKIPMGSAHLKGAAADIYDPDKKLQEWCLANLDLLETIGLWCEDFKYTHNWVHFQCLPYGSWAPGKSRFFIP